MTQSHQTPQTFEHKRKWVGQLVDAGFALIPYMAGTKHTYDHGWQNTPYDPLLTADDLPFNYGVILREDILVIDVDPKNFKDDINTLAKLFGDMGMEPDTVLDTFTVQTGSGGLHIYLKVPPGLKTRMTLREYPGIEVKTGHGHQVVGPGSTHPKTGNPYFVKRGQPAHIIPAPAALLEIYKQKEATTEEGLGYQDDPFTRDRYINWLKNNRAAIQGDNGDLLTMSTAHHGRDLGLPEETVLELMLEHWNERCEPPWTEKDLAKKVANAYKYAKEPVGGKHPSAGFTEVDEDAATPEEIARKKRVEFEKQWKSDAATAQTEAGVRWDWEYGRDGEPKGWKHTRVNVLNWFNHGHYGVYRNDLYELVRRNMFTYTIDFARPAPWHKEGHQVRRVWEDADTQQLIAHFGYRERWEPPENIVNGALSVYTDDHQYHPIREYLTSLTWDGEQRVETLFPRYAGAGDDPYTRAVSRCLLVAMVARVMLEVTDGYSKAGQYAKHDHVVVLEGKQGTGKSTFCQVLGGDYYKSLHLDLRNPKETIGNMQGGWVIELAEFLCRSRADADALKDFLSKPVDTYRAPYDRTAKQVPRQGVLIATLNPEDDMGYLQDQTGNRRFWPIATGRIDINALRYDRDQLLAEAFFLYRQGVPWYLDDSEIVKMATEQQALRTNVDVWADSIATWIDREIKNGTLPDKIPRDFIASDILNISVRDHNRRTFTRIAHVMHALGWASTRAEYHGGYRTAYRKILRPDLQKLLDEV
jgi:predicted P-loop ATPase